MARVLRGERGWGFFPRMELFSVAIGGFGGYCIGYLSAAYDEWALLKKERIIERIRRKADESVREFELYEKKRDEMVRDLAVAAEQHVQKERDLRVAADQLAQKERALRKFEDGLKGKSEHLKKSCHNRMDPLSTS